MALYATGDKTRMITITDKRYFPMRAYLLPKSQKMNVMMILRSMLVARGK